MIQLIALGTLLLVGTASEGIAPPEPGISMADTVRSTPLVFSRQLPGHEQRLVPQHPSPFIIVPPDTLHLAMPVIRPAESVDPGMIHPPGLPEQPSLRIGHRLRSATAIDSPKDDP